MYFSFVPKINDLLKIFIPKKKDDLIKTFYSKNNTYKVFSKSSWSISIFCNSIYLKKKRKINLVVPSYYCDYALKYIDYEKVNIIHCDINSNDNIDLNKLKLADYKVDVLISVNYFGKKCTNANIFDFCKTNNIYLIEDSTHCIIPTSEREYGDAILYSPYKFIGTISGAIILLNSKGPNKVPSNLLDNGLEKIDKKFKEKNIINSKFLVWFLKKIIQNIFNIKKKIQAFEIDKNTNNNESVYNDYLTEKLFISQLDKVHEMINVRRKSLLIWQNLFNKFNLKNSDLFLEKNFNPYSFIIEDEHEKIIKLYNFLKKNELPVSTWPDLNKKIKIDKSNYANYLRKTRLFLPIHSLKNLNYTNLIKRKFNKMNKNSINSLMNISFNKINSSHYQDILKKIKYVNLLQTPQHYNAKKINNFLLNCKYFELKVNGNTVGAFQLIFINFFFFRIFLLNRGPLFFENITDEHKFSIILEIIKIYEKNFFNKFIFIPEITQNKIKFLSEYKLLNFLKGYSWSTSLIFLTNDINSIRLNFSPKIRNALNKNFKDKKIKLKKNLDLNQLKNLLNILDKDQRIKKYKGLNKNYILSLFNQKCIHVYLAQKNDIIIGGVIVSEINDTSTYLSGFFDKSYSSENLGYKLLFLAITESKKRSIKFFDLGGIDSINNYGVSKFKDDFGGSKIILLGRSVL